MLTVCLFSLYGANFGWWWVLVCVCWILPIFICRLPIIRYKLRNVWVVWGTTFLATLLAFESGFYATYTILRPIFDDPYTFGFFRETNYTSLVIFLGCIGTAILSSMRAQYPFSEKTNQWLRSYKTRHRFTSAKQVVDLATVTIDDVLKFEPTKQWRPSYSLVLYIDTIRNGTHFLKIKTAPKKEFKLRKLERLCALIPVDQQQADMIRDAFGPFKKTWIIDPAAMSMLVHWGEKSTRL